MKKTRNLAAAFFCGVLVVLGMQSQAAAQEIPQNLGENKGTGDPVMRVGSWDLVRIKTTAKGIDLPRETKDLPVNTRERSGIVWSGKGIKINAAVVFMDLKKTVTGNNAGASDPNLKVLVKAEVTRLLEIGVKNDFVAMRCVFDFTLASGESRYANSGWSARQFKIYPGYYPASKKEEFSCGGDLKASLTPGEDFTLNYKLEVYNLPSAPADVTYHFFYQWAGWRSSTPFPGDTGVGSSDRDGQYRWAQKQDASTLESTLSSYAARLFSSPSVPSEKLSSAFADISVIIADRASKANFSSDDKDAASTNWSTHKNWAARQGSKVSLDNLQQRLSAAFKYLSRSLQDLFFADVSVAMAKAEVAEPANQAAAQGSTSGPTVKTKKPVYAPNERIEVEYANPAGHGWDWIIIAKPSDEKSATGHHGAITEKWASLIGEGGENDNKERRGTKSFDGLAEGQYEARYISWDSGNNRATARMSFTVGNAPPPPSTGGPPPNTGGPPPSTGNPPATGSSFDLSGLWVDDNSGNAVYRVRQLGNKIYWTMDATSKGGYVNVLHGEISGNTIDGEWVDMPGSPLRPALVAATITLRIDSNDRLVKVRSGNFYPAQVWTRQSSSSTAGPTPSTGNPPATGGSGELTGLWVDDTSGRNIYRLRHIGNKLYWGVDAVSKGSFANVFEGDVAGVTINGEWLDVPGSPALGGGKLAWRIESTCKLVKVSSSVPYGVQVLTRQGSKCDVVGVTQKIVPGVVNKSQVKEIPDNTKVTFPPNPRMRPAETVAVPDRNRRAQPKVEEIPDDVVATSKPPTRSRPADTAAVPDRNRRAQPKVEEIPEDVVVTTKPPTRSRPVEPSDNRNRTSQPKVEEIPEDVVVTTKPPTRSRPADTAAVRDRNRTSPPKVEEIPDDVVVTSQPPTRSRPAGRTPAGNRSRTNQPKVEEIPDDVVVTSQPPTQRQSDNTTSTRDWNQPITQPQPSTQRQPAGESWILDSITVSPETPPRGGGVTWTYNAQSPSARYELYNGDKANFQWTPPPQQIDSSSFTVSVGVQSHPSPRNRMASTIGVSASGLKTDTPPDQRSANASGENGSSASDQKSVTFTLIPNASEVEVRISFQWAVTYTYRYRRAQ